MARTPGRKVEHNIERHPTIGLMRPISSSQSEEQTLAPADLEPTLYASSADTSKLHELERTKTSLRSDAVGRTARCEQPSDKIDAPARVVKDKVTTKKNSKREAIDAYLAKAKKPNDWNEMRSALSKESMQEIEQSISAHFLGLILLDVRVPLVENYYNPRVPSAAAINSFFHSTGYGTDLQSNSLETAIKVSCSKKSIHPSSITTDLSIPPTQPVIWTKHAKNHPVYIIDGHHRIAVKRRKILKPLEDQLRLVGTYIAEAQKEDYSQLINDLYEQQRHLESCIAKECLWMALLYDKDGMELDDRAPELVLRLSGNQRLYTQPEADSNKLILLCAQWDKCLGEDKNERLSHLAAKLLDADSNKRLQVIVGNPRLMDTIAVLLRMEWMAGNPKWMIYTRLQFLATHSEGIFTPIVNSLRPNLAWLFSEAALNLPPFPDFLSLTRGERLRLLEDQRKHLRKAKDVPDIPPFVLELADKAYSVTFTTSLVLQLFGSNPKQHPNRCNQWKALMQSYVDTLCLSLQSYIEGYDGLHKASIAKLPTSLRYLLLSPLSRRSSTFQPNTCIFHTFPPLLTPGFVHDLVHMLSPDERDIDVVSAWKAAWTTLASSGEWSTLVELEDPVLGHGIVSMSNRYLRFSLNNPADSIILPFRRADVFLTHRLGGFTKLVCLMYQHLDKFFLRKMAPKVEDYLPVLKPGISLGRIVACIDSLLRQWFAKSPPGQKHVKHEIDFAEACAMMQTDVIWENVTREERRYLTVIFAMLANSEGFWNREFCKGRPGLQRSILVKKLIYALVRYTCNLQIFQSLAPYQLRHAWNNVSTPKTIPQPSAWDGITNGPSLWNTPLTEEDEAALMREYHFVLEDAALVKEQKVLEKVLLRSKVAMYTFSHVGESGTEEHRDEQDDLFVQGINLMRAAQYKMNYIKHSKLLDPSFDERDVTKEFVVSKVKESGQWLSVDNKPSNVKAYWDRWSGYDSASLKRRSAEDVQGGGGGKKVKQE